MEAMGSTVNGHTHVNNPRRQVNDGPDVLCPNCRWTWVMQGMLGKRQDSCRMSLHAA